MTANKEVQITKKQIVIWPSRAKIFRREFYSNKKFCSETSLMAISLSIFITIVLWSTLSLVDFGVKVALNSMIVFIIGICLDFHDREVPSPKKKKKVMIGDVFYLKSNPDILLMINDITPTAYWAKGDDIKEPVRILKKDIDKLELRKNKVIINP